MASPQDILAVFVAWLEGSRSFRGFSTPLIPFFRPLSEPLFSPLGRAKRGEDPSCAPTWESSFPCNQSQPAEHDRMPKE